MLLVTLAACCFCYNSLRDDILSSDREEALQLCIGWRGVTSAMKLANDVQFVPAVIPAAAAAFTSRSKAAPATAPVVTESSVQQAQRAVQEIRSGFEVRTTQ